MLNGGLVTFVLLALFIYSLLSVIGRKNYGKRIKRLVLCRGMSAKSKVSTNTRLQLHRAAPAFFQSRGLTAANIQSDEACQIPWLASYVADEFAVMVYELLQAKHKKFSQRAFVVTLFDYTDEIKQRLDMLDLPEGAERLVEEKSTSFVFADSASSLDELPSIIDRIGGLEASGEIYHTTATRLKKQQNSSTLISLLRVLVLASLSFVLAALLVHGVMTQSIITVSGNMLEPIYLEEQPFYYSMTMAFMALAFVVFVAHLVQSCKWKEKVIQRAYFRYVAATIIAFLATPYLLGADVDNPLSVKTHRLITAANKALLENSIAKSGTVVVTPIPLISPGLTELLKNNKFEELNNELDKYHSLAALDIQNEHLLFQAYLSFANSDDKVIYAINKWLLSEPSNPRAQLAEAFFFYGKGWSVRGTKNSAETPLENMLEMQRLMARSYETVTKLRKIEKYELAASILAINILQVRSGKKEAKQIFTQVIEKYPSSYLIRSHYMGSLTPRWGGSYLTMRAVIEGAAANLASNPQLALLEGEILEEAGKIAALADNYFQASEFYKGALRFGDNPYVLHELAKSEYRLKNYGQALVYFNQALALNANSHTSYYWRSKTHLKLKRLREAEQDQKTALAIRPYEKYYQGHYKSVKNAIAKKEYRQYYGFNAAGKPASTSHSISSKGYTAYQHALEMIEDGRFDSAVVKLIEAINADPHTIEYYITLDMVLGQTRQWPTIISYWQKFLTLYPDNARAHREISGTYYHNKENSKSLYHLKKAAELGDELALQRLKRIKGSD